MASMTVNDRLARPARGSLDLALAIAGRTGAQRQEEVRAFLIEVYRLAPLIGLDPAILVSQSAHETGNWRSPAWVDRLNPAGLGITDGPDFGFGWQNGADAARAQIVHMCACVFGDLPGAARAFRALDQRFQAVFDAGFAGTAVTLADLTGKWATDQQYAPKIAAKAAAIFGDNLMTSPQKEQPMSSIVFGNAPRPRIVDDIVDKPIGNGWDDYGPRHLRAVVLHRVVGAARFTSGHFRNLDDPHGRNALTDWGVCGSLDSDMDGVILKWNDPDSRRSPWASGPANNLNGDAVSFFQAYCVGDPAGASVFNRDTEAIELSGKYDTPLSRAQFEAACQLIAYRLDSKMQLPWTTWPKNHDGVQAILWHGEVNGWEKPCPGKVVIDATEAIINRVGEILKEAQSRESAGAATNGSVKLPAGVSRRSLDKVLLKKWFGEATAPSGKVYQYGERGLVAGVWRKRGEATGEFPRLEAIDEESDGTLIFHFTGGWKVIDAPGKRPVPADQAA